MSNQQLSPIELDEVSEIKADNSQKLSLESLILLINLERLKYLREKTHAELTELKQRQEQVTILHDLMKKINMETNTKGEFDCSSNKEIQELLKKAKDLGVDIKEGVYKFNKEARDRLIDNIRLTTDDLNVKNEMQLQTVNRLTNERYESYQMARSILRPLHDSKMQIARGIKIG
jgi:hypothetical protein